MESPAEYHTTPPLLRPLNPQENREIKFLNDALTRTKIQLNDRHAELRVMRVGIEELTKRALKAEARVAEQQKELGEQEVAMLRLIQENMTRII